MEGVPDIPESFFAIEASLGLGPNLPDKGMKEDREAEPAPEFPGKESRLIETSLPQTFHMEWNGKDQLHSRAFGRDQ
jgi:hypothetical protein